jgi:hypothetical protein
MWPQQRLINSKEAVELTKDVGAGQHYDALSFEHHMGPVPPHNAYDRMTVRIT